MFQEFLRANGAAATLMSGSGSTTFAVVPGQAAAEALAEKFKAKFGADELDAGGAGLTSRDWAIVALARGAPSDFAGALRSSS